MDRYKTTALDWLRIDHLVIQSADPRRLADSLAALLRTVAEQVAGEAFDAGVRAELARLEASILRGTGNARNASKDFDAARAACIEAAKGGAE
jgi:hypothetical protein